MINLSSAICYMVVGSVLSEVYRLETIFLLLIEGREFGDYPGLERHVFLSAVQV